MRVSAVRVRLYALRTSLPEVFSGVGVATLIFSDDATPVIPHRESMVLIRAAGRRAKHVLATLGDLGVILSIP